MIWICVRYGFGEPSDRDSVHIVSLAVAELLFCVHTAILHPLHFYLGVWRLGQIACIFGVATRYCLTVAGWVSLAAVSLKRYVVLRWPESAFLRGGWAQAATLMLPWTVAGFNFAVVMCTVGIGQAWQRGLLLHQTGEQLSISTLKFRPAYRYILQLKFLTVTLLRNWKLT